MITEHPQLEWGPELIHDLRQILRLAISEDLERGNDITSIPLVPRDAGGSANVVSREDGVIAGLETGSVLLEEMDSSASWEMHCKDGDEIVSGEIVATLRGPARDILVAERTLLNTLGHLSGVASLTQKFVKEVDNANVHVCDTRKTIPGWRRLEKYAVRCGGGTNHRIGLYDAVLIKDNHLAFGRTDGRTEFSVAESVETTRKHAESLDRDIIIQVEVDSVDQLGEVITAAPDIVLLDNMSNDQLRAAVALRNSAAPEICLEASGGVRLETIGAIAKTGVERISAGALTHSARQLDLGLDWCERH